MLRTRVGYAGGSTPAPDYSNMGDHTEVFQIDYDPAVISYERLLELFWEDHDPSSPGYGRQYRAVVLTATPEQARAARASADALGERGVEVLTEIEPLRGFTRAEDYHQKFYLRQQRAAAGELVSALGERGFVDSPLAARLNAYLGGHGEREAFERDLAESGLSEDAKALLRARFLSRVR